jgi:hypothetical protein
MVWHWPMFYLWCERKAGVDPSFRIVAVDQDLAGEFYDDLVPRPWVSMVVSGEFNLDAEGALW